PDQVRPEAVGRRARRLRARGGPRSLGARAARAVDRGSDQAAEMNMGSTKDEVQSTKSNRPMVIREKTAFFRRVITLGVRTSYFVLCTSVIGCGYLGTAYV